MLEYLVSNVLAVHFFKYSVKKDVHTKTYKIKVYHGYVAQLHVNVDQDILF